MDPSPSYMRQVDVTNYRSTARYPNCASTGHIRINCPSIILICANCTLEHNVFFRGCPVYKFELEHACLRFKHGLTLKDAKQEALLSGFQQVSLSQCISINDPQTTISTTFPPATSHPISSTHASSYPTTLVSCTITSCIVIYLP